MFHCSVSGDRKVSDRKTSVLIFLSAIFLLCLFGQTVFGQSPASGDWAQWGGPQRNFKAASTGLATSWKAALLNNNAWSVPVLAGTTLYARERRTITALDLKAPGPEGASQKRVL